EDAIRLHESGQHTRDVAVSKFQLGYVRVLQRRYDEALTIYAEARDTFASLGEPTAVATAWHQIGVVHRQAGELELAEQAYRQAIGRSPGASAGDPELPGLSSRRRRESEHRCAMVRGISPGHSAEHSKQSTRGTHQIAES